MDNDLLIEIVYGHTDALLVNGDVIAEGSPLDPEDVVASMVDFLDLDASVRVRGIDDWGVDEEGF